MTRKIWRGNFPAEKRCFFVLWAREWEGLGLLRYMGYEGYGRPQRVWLLGCLCLKNVQILSCFVPEIFKFSYYANLVTDDVIDCASTVVWHKIKNISANNEAMLLKLGRDQDYVRIRYSCHGPRLLRQLNDTKFYRRLDTDITSDIQTRVEFFSRDLTRGGGGWNSGYKNPGLGPCCVVFLVRSLYSHSASLHPGV